MEQAMSNEIKEKVKQTFELIKQPVRIIFFTGKINCEFCESQKELLKSLVELSPNIRLETYDFNEDREKVEKYRIDKIPATIIADRDNFRIRFFGLTGGHEFSSLINAIIMVGISNSGLHPELEELIKLIKKPTHIEVMVTLKCPYCPQAVHTAQQMAFVNPLITADMVEIAEFNVLAEKYRVSGVPKSVINQTSSFDGALPAHLYFMQVLKAADPELFQKIEQEIKETQTDRRIKKPDTKTEYDTIIIGAGPAGMSSAVYAARKGLNVLLLGKELGGQMVNTAEIDNYLGLLKISGRDIAEQFNLHMEQFPVAESLGAGIKSIEKRNNLFITLTEDSKEFMSHSVIYCAGKEYRKLGVLGEDKFIGRGIAFCATCDAPLYRNKKVAIVGGGNSAFTAARDLLDFADEIHIINIIDDFNADASLVREVKKSPKVKFYPGRTISEFKGEESLRSVIVISKDKSESFELPVDGVFLEIGLTPNTGPVKNLLKLNSAGEIPVDKDNATSIPGFYAAGDVTDIREKQIIVAAGEGAKAAISVYDFLAENKIINKTPDSY